VGRLPVVSTLHGLDEDALVRILSEPKNSIIKQFRKLLDLDGVNLRVTDEALRAIAREAIKRETGARGLRAIMEDIMLDVMYEGPATPQSKEGVVTEDVVQKREKPLLILESEKQRDAG